MKASDIILNKTTTYDFPLIESGNGYVFKTPHHFLRRLIQRTNLNNISAEFILRLISYSVLLPKDLRSEKAKEKHAGEESLYFYSEEKGLIIVGSLIREINVIEFRTIYPSDTSNWFQTYRKNKKHPERLRALFFAKDFYGGLSIRKSVKSSDEPSPEASEPTPDEAVKDKAALAPSLSREQKAYAKGIRKIEKKEAKRLEEEITKWEEWYKNLKK